MIDYLESERTGYIHSRIYGGQFGIEFEISDHLHVGAVNNYENLVEDAFISGAIIPSGRYSFNDVRLDLTPGLQRPCPGNSSLRRGEYNGGKLTSAGVSRGRIEVTPQLSLEPSVSFNFIDLPNGQFDQHVAATRATYILTPQAYVRGLVLYNSCSNTVSGNFRFGREWAPGSELFLVYTEERDSSVLDRWFQLRNRSFVIKVNRLLRP